MKKRVIIFRLWSSGSWKLYRVVNPEDQRDTITELQTAWPGCEIKIYYADMIETIGGKTQ